MIWRKQGRLFERPPGLDWADSGAIVPIARGSGDEVEIVFACRDADGRSRIGKGLIDLEDPSSARFHPQPLLDLGRPGAFDDNGVTASCCVEHEGRLHLFYIGWSLGVTVPFYTFIGLAISEDDGRTFTRTSPAPVLGRGPHDPCLATSPWVMVEDGLWRMWYASGVRWEQTPEGPEHYYCIKYAESADGARWERDGRVCIDFEHKSEHAIARPCVVRDGDTYRMWYSHRGEAYRIGYAESSDGLDWERKDDEAGIDVSEDGWDDEMIEYPFVFDWAGRRHMLYNGNGFGRTGVGHAVLEGE